MKTNIATNRSRRSGFTLIEISLVIALLLGLIAVAFIGIGSYRKGSDKAKCKMQLAAVQKAIRGHANMSNLASGADLLEATVFGAGKLMETKPVCPSGTAYVALAVVPPVGTAYVSCAYIGDGADYTHVLDAIATTDW
jgi:prepilin-type N-terminal cleavage/methylation domain-containing protein